ncbi:hypothetical protein C8R43DRAFT_1237061 [Mycena crocata]|nr:hypothetical protein C8R43DRAFT_1237061 [Mycena crocata]
MCCEFCKPLFPPLPTLEQTDELRDFLRSPEVPVGSSRAQYHAEMSSSMAALAQYDIEIDKQQETLRGLRVDRSKVQDYANGCRAALAPVRRLPPEVLCEIFAPFSHSDPAHTKEAELDNIAKFELLQLSQVCSYWHTLIMGTPIFWSDISVNTDCWPSRGYGDGCWPLNEALKTSLHRGARYPLNISVNLADISCSRGKPIPALSLLAAHSRRWQNLCLCMGAHQDYDFSQVNWKLDSLEKLSWRSKARELTGIEAITIFATAPRLTEVLLYANSPRYCPRLPWSRLRCFTYDAAGSYSYEVSVVLDMMRNMSYPGATFEVRNWNSFSVPSLDQPPFPCRIASFLVDMVDARITRRLFAGVSLPHLRELHLRPGGHIGWSLIANEFEALSLRSSFCDTLRTFDMCQVLITVEELVNCLASLPSLERLILSDSKNRPTSDHLLISDELFRRLTLMPDPTFASSLLPRLRHFDCTSCFKFDSHVYFDFIVSRVAGGGTPFHSILRPLHGGQYELDSEVHQKLLDLVATGGLRFHFETEIGTA